MYKKCTLGKAFMVFVSSGSRCLKYVRLLSSSQLGVFGRPIFAEPRDFVLDEVNRARR